MPINCSAVAIWYGSFGSPVPPANSTDKANDGSIRHIINIIPRFIAFPLKKYRIIIVPAIIKVI